ncbi:MAG: M28 family peptidase [Bacteroidales bacterium]|nr:M28 family peptidase [Bacteroidales bacterium]
MNNLRTFFILVFIISQISTGNAQEIRYVRQQLDILCNPDFHGRGYYKSGDRIAAEHLAAEFEKFDLNTYGKNYFQDYAFNVNSLEQVSVKINGKKLLFGDDYMMNASSGSGMGSFKPVVINAESMRKPEELFTVMEKAGNKPLIMIDSLGLNNPDLFRFVKTMILSEQYEISGLIETYSKTPGCRVGRKQLTWPYIQINQKAIPEEINSVEIDIKNKYYDSYPTQNVIGYIQGQSEKLIVFTAHYDAMGSFGEGNYFPGASDNASGTCMVLDLSRHYSSVEKPYYSIAFMLFSGEEAGLMGSNFYTDHPLFPLEDIKLVINLDMVGTGQDGVILFNGPQRPLEAAIVQKINEQKGYMKNVEEKDGSANSDHWPFHVKDVPAIFFLTKGQSGGGHNIFDTDDKLPLYAYENLFRLIIELTEELQRNEFE